MDYQKIGIIGAMVEEIEQLRRRMEQSRTLQKAGIVFTEGVIAGRSVVVCKSGVGKVNAAVCTQIVIDAFQADAIIFTGVAGALDPRLNIGDIVVSSECMQHDMDATPLGFQRGEIPYAETSVFPADAHLADLAYRASTARYPGRTIMGRVLSGDQFIADRETVRYFHSELNGACAEMEGAALAQVCAMNRVPYVVIRSMSDKADGTAHVNFAEFTVHAADRSCAIVEGMLQLLGPGGQSL